MGDSKRKRDRKPQNPVAETLDLHPTTAADDEAVLSVDREISAKIHHGRYHLRRRRKIPDHSSVPDFTVNGSRSKYMDGNGGSYLGHDLGIQSAVARARAVPCMDSVVKVFFTHTEPNFSLPWQRKRQYGSYSSEFVISGRRVLTNAHSLEHYTQVKLKKRASDTKYIAKVLAIVTECDVAMLTVDDDEFWQDMLPVKFGDLPALQDAVTVVGYPIGGDTMSVTSGVISRMEILQYVLGSAELLGLQIDAAINSGNSGGLALNGKGNCVGITFQSLKHDDAEWASCRVGMRVRGWLMVTKRQDRRAFVQGYN